MNFHPSEQLILAFVNEYFGDDYKNATNNKGQWINVASPWRRVDKRKCLGFNLTSGEVHDFYTGNHWKSLINFIKDYLSLNNYKEALRWLVDFSVKNRLDIGDFKNKEIKEENSNETVFPIIDYPPGSITIDYNNINPFTRIAVDYLKNRITQEEINKYGLKYCITGKFNNRIIIPIYDENGRFVWFQGRTVHKNVEPKYLNYEGEFRSHLVYNLHNIKQNDPIVICEGIFDAIKVGGCAIFGKSITFQQITKIISRSENIIIALDGDIPGASGNISLLDAFIKKGIDFKVVIFNGKKDFGDMSKEESKVAIDNAIPWSLQNDSAIRRILFLTSIHNEKAGA